MKSLLIVLAVTASIPAFAESYMECNLSGQTDGFLGAPQRIDLNEAGEFKLTVNGKAVKGFSLVERKNAVEVSYTSMSSGNIIESKIIFDYTTCEDNSQGSAIYTKTTLGSRGLKLTAAESAQAVATYQCSCGID